MLIYTVFYRHHWVTSGRKGWYQEAQEQHHLKHDNNLTILPKQQKEITSMSMTITILVDVQIFLPQWKGFNQYFHDSKHVKQSLFVVPIWPTLYPPLESKMLVSVLDLRKSLIPSSMHGIILVSCWDFFAVSP